MNSGELEPPSITSDALDQRRLLLLVVIFAAVSVLAGIDLLTDLDDGASVTHWVVELLLLGFGLFGLGAMGRSLLRVATRAAELETESRALSQRLRAATDATDALTDELTVKAAEAARWREETETLLRGLGEAVDRQFIRWALTNAEKEVAMLLLKGLSHKEIAAVRGTSEATNRQQARAAYRKAGLSGRSDLSAFFLEDLLLPR